MNSKEDILNYIDNMSIYHDDYQIINNLMNVCDPKLFTKILEEVIDGNLYWSDFERYLNNTYDDIVISNLRMNNEIETAINKYVAFRELVRPEDNADNNICVLKNSGDSEFYNEELTRIRMNALFALSSPDKDETESSRLIKSILFNLIKNGYVLNETIERFEEDHIQYEIKDNKIIVTADGTTNEYSFINPDDIFLYLYNYIIPLDEKYQIIDEYDRLMSDATIEEINRNQKVTFSLDNPDGSRTDEILRHIKSLILIDKRNLKRGNGGTNE